MVDVSRVGTRDRRPAQPAAEDGDPGVEQRIGEGEDGNERVDHAVRAPCASHRQYGEEEADDDERHHRRGDDPGRGAPGYLCRGHHQVHVADVIGDHLRHLPPDPGDALHERRIRAVRRVLQSRAARQRRLQPRLPGERSKGDGGRPARIIGRVLEPDWLAGGIGERLREAELRLKHRERPPRDRLADRRAGMRETVHRETNLAQRIHHLRCGLGTRPDADANRCGPCRHRTAVHAVHERNLFHVVAFRSVSNLTIVSALTLLQAPIPSLSASARA